MPCQQNRYYMLVIAHHLFTPYLPKECQWIKGQLERGSDTGYLHWQCVVAFPKKVSFFKVKEIFGNSIHIEATKSAAANEYSFKEDTRVGHQFELGHLAMKRNCSKDWEDVWTNAQSGDLSKIPADIRVRCYTTLKKIHVDSLQPTANTKEVYVFWGKTGTGKSKRAWEEATFDAYPKDPCTKWWCGYSGQENVVLDEFRGQIGISHLLRWFDRYPTVVETKGSATVFRAKRIWITSNLSPDEWYPDLDEETRLALRRRFTNVIHFN